MTVENVFICYCGEVVISSAKTLRCSRCGEEVEGTGVMESGGMESRKETLRPKKDKTTKSGLGKVNIRST